MQYGTSISDSQLEIRGAETIRGEPGNRGEVNTETLRVRPETGVRLTLAHTDTTTRITSR